jgi:heme A synthase
MKSRWLHRYAILVSCCTLLLLVTGGSVTNNPYRPLYAVGETHTAVGILAGILTAGLAVWLSRVEKRTWPRRLGWIALAIVAVEALLGRSALLSAATRVTHSLLAQLFFSITVVIVFFTSSRWQRDPEQVEGTSSLRYLAKIAPALVLAQVALGVAFRHGVASVMPHILGAFVVALLIVGVAMPVINRPEHAALRPAGISLLVVTLLQVFLGLVLFVVMGFDDIDPLTVIALVLAHTITGALTLAISIVMALMVWRSVRAPSSET